MDIKNLLIKELDNFEFPNDYLELNNPTTNGKMTSVSTSTEELRDSIQTMSIKEGQEKKETEEKESEKKQNETDEKEGNEEENEEVKVNLKDEEVIIIKENDEEVKDLDAYLGEEIKDVKSISTDAINNNSQLKNKSYTELELEYLSLENKDKNLKAKQLAGLIEELILGYNIERYKYIVQVNLFQNKGHGTIMDSAMFWDTEKDKMIQETYKKEDFICTVVIFALYYN
ncbi:hypothetical protein K502DRAFT_329519 [Neoconidiobolus thromboides FSU 785]|nr:hypothetical protein K502DRAFT_329519 [Neoconidiobolus thromboides FSU 785]